MTSPAVVQPVFVGPTPIPSATIMQLISTLANVQCSWLHGPQRQVGMQGPPGRMAWVYLNISRYRAIGDDDYRETESTAYSSITAGTTVSLINGSPNITFSQPQTLQQGSVFVFSPQPGSAYTLSLAISNAQQATLTAPYAGGSTPSATVLPVLATNLCGQRIITVTCRAESLDPSLQPFEILERVRWGKLSVLAQQIKQSAGLAYNGAGDIRYLGKQVRDEREVYVAVMDLEMNFATNNYPIGQQAPGRNVGTTIGTVNQGTQVLGTAYTIVGEPTP